MTAMIEVTQEDANNYCLVLKALGMEEEGDPVAAIEMLREAESVNAEMLEALKRVSSTLEAIGDLPSMKADVDAAIYRAESAIETPAKVSPCAGQPAEAGDCTKGERE